MHQKEPAIPLPIKQSNKRRKLLIKYASLIWRENEIEKIADKLEGLYEEVYSKGLTDMDRMHQAIDKKLQPKKKAK